MAGIMDTMKEFIQHDAQRRMGTAGDTQQAAVQDRMNEGKLMAEMGAPTAAIGAAGLGYEGIKSLGQKFPTLGSALPGPFKVDETTSPASMENVYALLKGAGEADGPEKKFLNLILGDK